MPIIPIIVAASHSSRKQSSKKKSSNVLSKMYERECEEQYGEICYKCWVYIGDATGKPELCENCKNIKSNK